MARLVLAMSGGVDSSVAASLLREAGHEVIGLFMRHGIDAEQTCGLTAAPLHKQGCCSAADAEDARRVAERLDIPFYALNFEAEFARIVDHFVDEYTSGRTPNPCIDCNTSLKFGKLFEYADGVGAEFVATGHYARMERSEECRWWTLKRGRDAHKDQSYVLFGIPRERLGRILLPVGDYSKEAIREKAERLGLDVADKPDSQEICFVHDGDHASLVRRRSGRDTSGEIVAADGTVVGRHAGIERFTIGQRKGLGIAFGEPRYVLRIEPESNRVVIGTHDELARQDLFAHNVNWLIDRPTAPFPCHVKIRYRSPPVAATVTPLPESRIHVTFTDPIHAIAPGQAAVCYAADRVLGGGWIE